jgi:hypothetical protein
MQTFRQPICTCKAPVSDVLSLEKDELGVKVAADTLGFAHYPSDLTAVMHTLQAAAGAEIVGKLSCSGHWWVAVRPHKAQPYKFPLSIKPLHPGTDAKPPTDSDPTSTARTPADPVHGLLRTHTELHNCCNEGQTSPKGYYSPFG